MTTEFPRMTCALLLVPVSGSYLGPARLNTYHHANGDFFTTSLLFKGLVENNVHEYLQAQD